MPGKFCYETKVDTSRSEIAKQVAQARPKITQSRRLKLHAVARVQEVEEAKEEERKIARPCERLTLATLGDRKPEECSKLAQ